MPDIPQSERRGDKLAVTYYNSATGDYEKRPLLGDASGAAHVLDGITQVPRYPIHPTVNGLECSQIRVNSSSGTTIDHRFVANPMDASAAATKLAYRRAGVTSVYAARRERITVPADPDTPPITSVYLEAVNHYGTHGGGIIKDSSIFNMSDPSNPQIGMVAHHTATPSRLLGPTSTPSAWADATSYNKNDYVIHNSVVYTAISNHTSATATDEPGAGSGWEDVWIPIDDLIVEFRFDAAKNVREVIVDCSEYLNAAQQITVLSIWGRQHAE